jgi:hypothetical protein
MGSPSTRKSSIARSSVASSTTISATGRQTILPFVPVPKSQAIALPLSPSRKNTNANPLLDSKALNYGAAKSSSSLKQTSLLNRLKSVKTNSSNSTTKVSTKENQPTSSSQPSADVSSSTGARRTLKRSNSAFSSLDIVGKDWLQNAPTKRSCKVINKTHVRKNFKKSYIPHSLENCN